MSDWERAICARVKTVRESIRWSQPAFAEQLGMSRDQLAGIEYGRTPLRYDIAWRLRTAFGISLLWLEGDDCALPDSFEHDNLPIPSATGLPRRALLSDVARRFRSSKSPALKARGPEPEIRSEAGDEVAHRAFSALVLKMKIDEWIARLPDGYVAPFRDQLWKAMESLMTTLPGDPDDVVARRMDDLMWEKIRMANARRVLVTKDSQRKMLTKTESSEILPPVKSQLKNLLADLNRLTKESGKKTELADYLGAPLASVSRWLSGEREPGGETTLKMLRWVQQQER
jgi:transcriptional regulator with XRE-family HTH domain